jgi:hypothetical protein
LLTDDITFRHRTVADADGILGRHFTQWCAKFKIFPLDMGYGTESGYAAYPAHAVTESDGTVWLTAFVPCSSLRLHFQTEPRTVSLC